MSVSGGGPSRRGVDPFRILAIMSIVLGFLIILFSAVVWYFANRLSATLMSGGVILAGAGSAKEAGERFLSRAASYYTPSPTQPPSEQPPPELHVLPRRPPKEDP